MERRFEARGLVGGHLQGSLAHCAAADVGLFAKKPTFGGQLFRRPLPYGAPPTKKGMLKSGYGYRVYSRFSRVQHMLNIGNESGVLGLIRNVTEFGKVPIAMA